MTGFSSASTPAALGASLRGLRKAQGLRLEDVASAAGVGMRFLSELERGKPTAQLAETLRVAAALGVRVTLDVPTGAEALNVPVEGPTDGAECDMDWWSDHRDLMAALGEVAVDPQLETLVLFGSLARGDERDASDVDLIADGPAVTDFASRRRIAGQLSERLGRSVELTPLASVMRSPSVLAGAIADGRVVLDRAGRWRAVRATRSQIEAEAAEEHAAFRRRRARALAQISGSGS